MAIFTTLDRHPELESQVISLIEGALGYSPHHSFREDFFLLVCPSNWKHCHVALDVGGCPVAHVGVRLEVLAWGEVRTPVALVGGIAVCEDFRGQGIFRRLFEQVMDHYRDRVSLFFLWSDKRALYEKFRFVEFGLVYEYGLEDLSPEAYQRVEDVAPFVEDLALLYDRGHRDYLCLERDMAKWDLITRMTSLDFYLLFSGKTPTDYYVKNKGQDLGGIVHEYSIRPPPGQTRIWGPLSPPHHRGAKTLFFALGALGHGPTLAQFMGELTEGRLEMTGHRGGLVSFTLDGVSSTLEEGDFIRSLWGPDFREELSTLVPPLWISGIDSV